MESSSSKGLVVDILDTHQHVPQDGQTNGRTQSFWRGSLIESELLDLKGNGFFSFFFFFFAFLPLAINQDSMNENSRLGADSTPCSGLRDLSLEINMRGETSKPD